MTDAHYHVGEETRLSLNGRVCRFCGIHPWSAETVELADVLPALRQTLESDGAVGVGEIGLDRLKTRNVTERQKTLFAAQLQLAAEFRRPVVLHGAKCWGEVVRTVQPFASRVPAFLFHGFSRSGGLLPEIVALNGFVSVGPAILNDHAVNYRALVKTIPSDRLLVETDATAGSEQERSALVAEVFAKTAELTGLTETQLNANATTFASAILPPSLP